MGIDKDFFNTIDWSTPPIVSDATYVSPNTYIDNNLPKDIIIDSGQWKFTIARPQGDLSKQWKPKTDLIQYFDERELAWKQYEYTVDRLVYRSEDDELDVYITIKGNSPALYIVYGAVVAVIGIVVSLTARSVLKSVEKLVATVPETFKKLETSPLVWAIALIFLVPVLVAGYKTAKR